MFKGKIEIYSEVCCDWCMEIVHNHMDCPACGRKGAGTAEYHDLNWEGPPCVVTCGECGAEFKTDDYPYDSDSEWEQVEESKDGQ